MVAQRRPEPPQDRGRNRREALTRAAAQIVLDEGFDAVSHRSVARRAGVPLGSTTYYFASLDDLLAAAASRLFDRWVQRAWDVAAGADAGPYDPDRAGAILVRALLPGRAAPEVLPLYEQLVGAARRPVVAEALGAGRPRLNEVIADLLARTGWNPGPDPELVLAVVDGAAVSALSEGRADVAGQAEALLAEFLASSS